MKCPKCSYISFDTPERCRNCGFDFSPGDAAASGRRSARSRSGRPRACRPISRWERPRRVPARRRPRPPNELTPADLPLFDQPVAGVDDTPLITTPSPPRTPLSVRRSTLDAPRPRDASSIAVEDLDSEPPGAPEDGGEDLEPVAVAPPSASPVEPDVAPVPTERHPSGEPASIVRRLLAALYDATLIAAIDGAVLYFTLETDGSGVVGVDPLAAGASRSASLPF